jgi:hypothetical protein
MDTEESSLPPNPELLNRQPKWFKPAFYGAIVASVLFALVCLLLYPRFVGGRRGPHHQGEATNNARQIGLALYEFDTDYGQFPIPTTRPLVEKDFSTAIDLSGTSSNALFRQLFATGLTLSEQMFYAKIKGSVRPDGLITPGNILEPGECGFSYISNLSSKDDPLTPLVLTPLIPGTTKFDPKPFKGKAVILHIDNSVRTYDIAKDGHIYDSTGINLLSPKHPVWKGKAPDIRYPEL